MRALIISLTVLFTVNMSVAQTVIYDREPCDNGDVTNFVRVVTQHYNAYAISPKAGVMLTSLQVGYPVSFLGGLTVGAGVEGCNGFDEFSFGFWGAKQFWQSGDYSFSFVVGKSTFDLHGEYLMRWFFPFAYKKVSLVPNLFRSHQGGKTVNDAGLSLNLDTPFKTGVGITRWFDRGWWWFTVKKTF